MAPPTRTPETIMTAVQTRTKKQVAEFYECILQYANAICTTLHASTTKPYKTLKEDAGRGARRSRRNVEG